MYKYWFISDEGIVQLEIILHVYVSIEACAQ